MLTKSKYMNGLQCLRLLWFSYKKQLPEHSLFTEHKFAQGHDFEVYVKQVIKGVDLDGLEYKDNLEKTSKLIKKKRTIFEAGIEIDSLFMRVDILEYKNGWNLYEIKSSTKVKPEHIPDLAFQKYVFEKKGINIEKCFLVHLNKEYIKKGKIKTKELVEIEEVTEKVKAVEGISQNIERFLQVMKASKPQEAIESISKNCNKPHECVLKSACWGKLPENNILHLTHWQLYWKLFNRGIIAIKDISKSIELKPKDQVIVEAVNKKKTIISDEHIKHFLNSLNYPLHHFDFETIDTAVPIFDNSRPWQKIPFQYSLHIEQEDGSLEHHEFLAEENDDPRPALLEALKKVIGKTGDVIVFNKTFEVKRLQELAEDFPQHKDWIENVLNRIVDLAGPFQAYYYYNPLQKGKYSIKKVLPAVTGESYDKLEVNNGGDASAQFFYSHIKSELKNKAKIRKDLLKYCGLDTEGMVWIIKELKKLV